MFIELVVASVVIVVNVIVANVISAITVVELGLDPLLDLLTASLGSPAELCDYLNPMQWNCCTEVYNLLYFGDYDKDGLNCVKWSKFATLSIAGSRKFKIMI